MKPRPSRSASALAALLVASLLPAPAAAIWPFRSSGYPDPALDLRGAAGALLSQAIRIPTVNPPGNERDLAELLVRVLRREKITARVIDTPSNGARARRAAAWARVPGNGSGRPVILLSHLDVVPADADRWLVDPFAGVEAGGYVVGRGALDSKGVAVVHLLTLVELARREQKLDRDVIFLSTPDEEAGGRAGAGFVVRERPELLHDAEFLLTEGGGILDSGSSSPDIWGITLTEKTPCWIRVAAQGSAGHSSAASMDAAVPRLIRALDRVRRMETELQVVPSVARMFDALSPIAPDEDRFALRNLSFSLSSDPEFRGRFLADPARNALVRNTVAITVLEGSSRTNVVPAEAFAHLDARLLPGEQCEQFEARVRTAIDDPSIGIKVMLSFSPQSSPAQTPLFQAIRKVAAKTDPDALVVPRVIAGFTDAHYFREVGIVAYGFVPRWLPPHETRGIHGPNERISVENLERGVRTLVRILETLDSTDPQH